MENSEHLIKARKKWLEKAVRGPKNEDYYLPNATEEDIKSICLSPLQRRMIVKKEKKEKDYVNVFREQSFSTERRQRLMDLKKALGIVY